MAKDKSKKKFSFPSAFTILFLLLIVIALAPGSSLLAHTTMTQKVHPSQAPTTK
jgi:hypothetical protein